MKSAARLGLLLLLALTCTTLPRVSYAGNKLAAMAHHHNAGAKQRNFDAKYSSGAQKAKNKVKAVGHRAVATGAALAGKALNKKPRTNLSSTHKKKNR